MPTDLEQQDQELFPSLTQKHEDHGMELKSGTYKTKTQEDITT